MVETRSVINFTNPVVIYLPCYNCATKIAQTLEEIPKDFHDMIECLVVDNDSTDATAETVRKIVVQRKYPFPIHLVKMTENAGYAGSQKTAYHLVRQSPVVKRVIMLHGDGQYPSALLNELKPYVASDYALVNGYRCKKTFPEKEETPKGTYRIIKLLSWIESAVLGIPQKEWHSGLVMFSTDFLRRIPLGALCSWMHIDGEFLMCAHILKEKTLSVPIYKRYKKFKGFGGWARIRHILQVFRLMGRYLTGHYHRLLKSEIRANPDFAYTLESWRPVKERADV